MFVRLHTLGSWHWVRPGTTFSACGHLTAWTKESETLPVGSKLCEHSGCVIAFEENCVSIRYGKPNEAQSSGEGTDAEGRGTGALDTRRVP